MNEWARSQCFDDQDMLTRINCAGKRMMQYATHTLFTCCEGVEPTSFAKIVPFFDVKFKIGDFISDLKVISFSLYSYLLFPFFSATPCAAGTLGEKEADSTSHFRFDPIRVFYENFGF